MSKKTATTTDPQGPIASMISAAQLAWNRSCRKALGMPEFTKEEVEAERKARADAAAAREAARHAILHPTFKPEELTAAACQLRDLVALVDKLKRAKVDTAAAAARVQTSAVGDPTGSLEAEDAARRAKTALSIVETRLQPLAPRVCSLFQRIRQAIAAEGRRIRSEAEAIARRDLSEIVNARDMEVAVPLHVALTNHANEATRKCDTLPGCSVAFAQGKDGMQFREPVTAARVLASFEEHERVLAELRTVVVPDVRAERLEAVTAE